MRLDVAGRPLKPLGRLSLGVVERGCGGELAQIRALDNQILSCFLIEGALELFLLKPASPHALLLGWTVDFDDLSVLYQSLWLPLGVVLLLVGLR